MASGELEGTDVLAFVVSPHVVSPQSHGGAEIGPHGIAARVKVTGFQELRTPACRMFLGVPESMKVWLHRSASTGGTSRLCEAARFAVGLRAALVE